jgi:hypothetical protein
MAANVQGHTALRDRTTLASAADHRFRLGMLRLHNANAGDGHQSFGDGISPADVTVLSLLSDSG